MLPCDHNCFASSSSFNTFIAADPALAQSAARNSHFNQPRQPILRPKHHIHLSCFNVRNLRLLEQHVALHCTLESLTVVVYCLLDTRVQYGNTVRIKLVEKVVSICGVRLYAKSLTFRDVVRLCANGLYSRVIGEGNLWLPANAGLEGSMLRHREDCRGSQRTS